MKDVGTPTELYTIKATSWKMLQDLLGGTAAMRVAGEVYLPKDEKESTRTYETRLRRSFLYNGFGNTVDRLSAKPFKQPLSRLGELPKELEAIEGDVDKAGTTLGQFAKSLFRCASIYGLTHVLVDYSNVPQNATKADEAALGARPTLVHIDPSQLIGWRYEIGPNGQELTQIRIIETRDEPNGDFDTKCVDYVRVYTKTEWAVYKETIVKSDKGTRSEWQLVESGTHTFGKVPLLTMYFNRTGFMLADPPLQDLAWVNVRHWQSSSEQNAMLRIARIGILFAKGFPKEEIEAGITLGPNHLVSSDSIEAELKFVEHQGTAIKAGQDDLYQLEARMEVLGLKPMVEKSGNSTATGKVLDELDTQSTLQAWVRELENFLWLIMEAAGKWINIDLPDTVKYNVYNDFGLTAADAVHLEVLLEAAVANKISDETFLNEFKRRSVLSESVKVEEEVVKVVAQRAEAAKLDKQAKEPK